MSHIPEDRHRYGLVLDYDLKNNMVLERYYQPEFSSHGWVKFKAIKNYSDRLIKAYDVRSGQGSNSLVRSMSGGNQQKAIVAREMDRGNPLLVACQPTRGLDVGAIEFIHKEIVVQRDQGKAVLLLSLELEEVMNLSDRILVMHEGQIVGDLDPKKVTMEELGLYMSGAKSDVLPPLDPVDMAADEKEDNLEPAAEEKPAEEPQAQKTPEDVKPAAEPAVAKKPSEEAKPEAETVKEEAKPTEEAKPETAAPAKEETAETPSVKETEPAAKPEEEKMDTEAIKPTEDKTEEPKAEEPEQEKPEEAKPAEEVKPAEAVSEEKAPATEEQKPAEPIKAEAKPAPVKEEPKPVETQPAPKKNPVPANFAKKNATPAPVVKKPHKLTKAELKMIRLKNLRQYKGKDEDEIKKEVKK
jgi:ABC-type multidrug transport system ATPase subunit